MIKQFTDHSANERTYLAWIRTAIAIMAFGFLVEKFDIFIHYMGHALNTSIPFKPSRSAEFVGIGMLLVSIAMIFGASMRFFYYKKSIDSESVVPFMAKRPNILLSLLMIFIGLFLLVYLVHQLYSL